MNSERSEAVAKAHRLLTSTKTLDAAQPVPEILMIANDELWRVDDVMNFGVRLQEIRKDLRKLVDEMEQYG